MMQEPNGVHLHRSTDLDLLRAASPCRALDTCTANFVDELVCFGRRMWTLA